MEKIGRVAEMGRVAKLAKVAKNSRVFKKFLTAKMARMAEGLE